MLVQPLMDPGSRKYSGYDTAQIRVYKNGPGAIVLFNKSAAFKMGLQYQDRVQFTYSENQLYLSKLDPAAADHCGYRLKQEDSGRIRIYLNREEFLILKTFLQLKENKSIILIPGPEIQLTAIELQILQSYRLEIKNV